MHKLLPIGILIFIFSVFCMQAMAQPLPPDPVAAPLDGMTTLLIAGGVAVAARTLNQKRKP